jgi:hypothetical protein
MPCFTRGIVEQLGGRCHSVKQLRAQRILLPSADKEEYLGPTSVAPKAYVAVLLNMQSVYFLKNGVF